MSKLNAKERDKLSKSNFGMPSQRKYPMPDKSHAANAKARAQQQYDKGNLSGYELKKIDSKANGILKKGEVKKTPFKKLGLLNR